jgi:hypothetical protein
VFLRPKIVRACVFAREQALRLPLLETLHNMAWFELPKK